MNLRYLILGLITRRPMTGYDIRSYLKGFGWLIGSPSFGGLYPALNALLEAGWVSVEVLPRTDKASRKLYSVTEAGKAGLEAWISESATPFTSLKAFVMHLLLADSLSPPALRVHMEGRRRYVADRCSGMRAALATEGLGDDRGLRMALEYGLALAEAELAWLDGALAAEGAGPESRESEEESL